MRTYCSDCNMIEDAERAVVLLLNMPQPCALQRSSDVILCVFSVQSLLNRVDLRPRAILKRYAWRLVVDTDCRD